MGSGDSLCFGMATALAEPIATYIAGVNGHEVDSAAGCFEEDASVLDEGRTIRGRNAIKQWIVETKKKYRHTIDPLKSEKKDDTVLVTCRLSGEFPGSPIEAPPRREDLFVGDPLSRVKRLALAFVAARAGVTLRETP